MANVTMEKKRVKKNKIKCLLINLRDSLFWTVWYHGRGMLEDPTDRGSRGQGRQKSIL